MKSAGKTVGRFFVGLVEGIPLSNQTIVLAEERIPLGDQTIVRAEEDISLGDQTIVRAKESLPLDDQSVVRAEEGISFGDHSAQIIESPRKRIVLGDQPVVGAGERI